MNKDGPTEFVESLESEIQNLKRTLMNKIDEAILESPKRTFKEKKSNSQEIKEMIREKEVLEKARNSFYNKKENEDPNIDDSVHSKQELSKREEKIKILK